MTGPSARARRSNPGALVRLCVPKTTSTHPTFSWMRSRSFWARHPPTAICRPGLGVDQLLEAPERAVEPLVGVLPDAARVEHHHVGVLHGGGRRQAVGHQQPGEPLGVVLVHLAPEGADEVGPGHPPESRERATPRFSTVSSSAHRSCGGARRALAALALAARAGAGRARGSGGSGGSAGSQQSPDARLKLAGVTVRRARSPPTRRPRSVRVPIEPGRVPRGRRPHARGPDPRLRQRARRRPRVHDAAGRPDRRTRTQAQTLANSLEILGDAQPTQANYDQVLNTFNVNAAITQLQGAVRKAERRARRVIVPAPTAGPRPRPRRRCPRRSARSARTRPGTPRRGERGLGPGPHGRPLTAAHHADQGRSGARPAGGERARRRRGRAAARAPRGTAPCGPAGGCGRPSLSATSTSGSARPATSRPMRPRLNTTSARESVSGSTPRASGVARLRSGTMTTKASSSAQRERRVHGPALHGRRRDEPAEHAGRRVLGMPVVGGRHREGILGARGGGRRGGERRRRSPAPGRRGSASAPSPRSGRGPGPRPPPGRPGATRRRRGRPPRLRCARGATGAGSTSTLT